MIGTDGAAVAVWMTTDVADGDGWMPPKPGMSSVDGEKEEPVPFNAACAEAAWVP